VHNGECEGLLYPSNSASSPPPLVWFSRYAHGPAGDGCKYVPPSGLGKQVLSVKPSAPVAAFGKSGKIADKPNPTPGPGAYPALTTLGG
jgi:hypothetical protein